MVVVRATTFYFSSPVEVTFRAQQNYVEISVIEEAYVWGNQRFVLQTSLRGARFAELLREAGIDELWSAGDDDCTPEIAEISEIGTTLEYLDARGYYARSGPRAQACDTEYSLRFRAVLDVLGEAADYGRLK
jgi:hypothetical protein